jgi:multicomponent Na+:H+ antiporter subunit D
MTADTAVAVSMALPAVAAVVVLCLGRWPNIRDGVMVAFTGITFSVVASILPHVQAGARPGFESFEVIAGIPLAFEVEPLGMVYALVASGLWIPTALYGIGYMRGHDEDNQTRFFACFCFAIFAALGIAFSRNLLTLFFFYEILTFSTYPLVTHHGDDKARKAGRVYMGNLLFTSVVFLLMGIMWTFSLTGTLEFKLGGILAGTIDGWAGAALLACFAFGAGKAALMPFHRWLPAAMVAPTPVSALLHAVAIVKAGVFTILKVVVYIFGIEFLAKENLSLWLMYAAAITILVSSCVALTKDNLKARLAYSTISQLAYITLGAALATSMGVIGAGMHIAMHAVGKITLFFCAGALMVGAHKTEISDMDGIGRTMPFTMGAFFIGSMSIIGLPPMGGAWSKWYLALGAAQGHHWIFIAVLMASSLLSIGYLMPVVGRAFFFAPKPAAHGHGDDHGHGAPTEGIHEAPILCVIPLCMTAFGCLLLFFFSSDLQALLAPIAMGG